VASREENSSREISRFEGRRQTLLQNSITGLMEEEAEFERQREEELRRKRKAEESMLARFNRRMRENIVHAKLRRRRR
jgi:hypothetical protein